MKLKAELSPWRLVCADSATPLFTLLALVPFMALTLFVTMHHEPWRDEADVWLATRDMSLPQLFHWAPYVGSPLLWHLLVAPFAKAGLSPLSQNLLHLAVAWTAMVVFLAFSPFTRLTRVLFLFGFYASYEYAVIARSYALTVLFTFLLAALSRKRREHPVAFAAVVALLFNTNVHGAIIAAFFAAICGFEVLRERRLQRTELVGPILMALGAVLAFLQLKTPPDGGVSLLRHTDFRDVAVAISTAAVPGFGDQAVLIGVLILILTILVVRKSMTALLLVVGGTMVLSSLFAFVWYGGFRHAGMLLLTWLVAVWIAADEGVLGGRLLQGFLAVMLNLAFAVSIVVAAHFWRYEVRFAFSAAREMGEVLAMSGLDGVEVAAHFPGQCEAVLPYWPGKRLWYAALQRYGTYMPWDAALDVAARVPYPIAIEVARRHFGRKPWVQLLNRPMPDPAAHGFRLLYATKSVVFEKKDEQYWLYAPTR